VANYLEEYLKNLYSNGALMVDPSTIFSEVEPGNSFDFILRKGLPRLEKQQLVLGVEFKAGGWVDCGGERFFLFGRETWADNLGLGIREGDGRVFAISEGVSNLPVFINSSFGKYIEFLELTADFFDRSKQGDSGATVMSAEQARERLAAMRRGEVKPAKSVIFDREKEVEKLKKMFLEIDPDALDDDFRWAIVLEQIEDGLI
jgi:hypothetical protein